MSTDPVLNVPDPRQVSYLAISELHADPRNPKSHDLDTIDASIGRFGVLDLIVKDERTGYIISGHGRRTALAAMQERGEKAPEGVKVDDAGNWLVPVVTGWASRTDAEASAALIALNRTTELGGWVDDALLELLDELDDGEGGLVGVGYGDDEIAALRAGLDELEEGDRSAETELDEYGYPYEGGLDDEDAELEPSGQAFKTLDVLVGEPKHAVKHGEVYRLGGRHYLVVAKLAREHEQWSHLLEGRVFAPYPDVYLALGTAPKSEEHLFVQPNAYLAGHLLDKWASVHGEDSIVREVAP